jgi:hypothetical protein
MTARHSNLFNLLSGFKLLDFTPRTGLRPRWQHLPKPSIPWLRWKCELVFILPFAPAECIHSQPIFAADDILLYNS